MVGGVLEFWTQRGGCSSMAERLTVDQEVVGSTPIIHPIFP